jgi:hypothetical protein
VQQKLRRAEDAARSLQQFLSLAPPHLKAEIEDARQRLAELRGA